MTLTILYRHGDRPDDAKMTMISSQENVETIVDELEQRGFVVEKITVRSASRTPHRDDMPILNGECVGLQAECAGWGRRRVPVGTSSGVAL